LAWIGLWLAVVAAVAIAVVVVAVALVRVRGFARVARALRESPTLVRPGRLAHGIARCAAVVGARPLAPVLLVAQKLVSHGLRWKVRRAAARAVKRDGVRLQAVVVAAVLEPSPAVVALGASRDAHQSIKRRDRVHFRRRRGAAYIIERGKNDQRAVAAVVVRSPRADRVARAAVAVVGCASSAPRVHAAVVVLDARDGCDARAQLAIIAHRQADETVSADEEPGGLRSGVDREPAASDRQGPARKRGEK
jgi:hypothetical protein